MQVWAHRPAWQPTIAFMAGGHAAPHAPQFALSFCGSTQARPHAARPFVHIALLASPSFGGGFGLGGIWAGGVPVSSGGGVVVSRGVVSGGVFVSDGAPGSVEPGSGRTPASPDPETKPPSASLRVRWPFRTQVFVATSHT